MFYILKHCKKFESNQNFLDKFLKIRSFINLQRGHARSYKKCWPARFSRFDIYRIQTDKQTNTKTPRFKFKQFDKIDKTDIVNILSMVSFDVYIYPRPRVSYTSRTLELTYDRLYRVIRKAWYLIETTVWNSFSLFSYIKVPRAAVSLFCSSQIQLSCH